MKQFLRVFFDLVYPPLCAYCKEKNLDPPYYGSLLCPSCWFLSLPFDIWGRCVQCFIPIHDPKKKLCRQCHRAPLSAVTRAFVFDRNSPLLSITSSETLAGYVAFQWSRLRWPMPDAIVALSEEDVLLAKETAPLLSRPYAKIEELDVADLTLLAIDIASPIHTVRQRMRPLFDTFPKNIYQLSLHPYDLRDYLD